MADATVYIPTLNGGERLAECLDSLRRQTVPVEVVVADNGPGKGSGEELRVEFPEVTRVGFGRNLGFGPALNRAIDAGGDGKIILLNDDAVAKPDFVERLLEKSGSADMVAGVLVSKEDPNRIDSAGFQVDQTLMASDYLSGQPLSALAGAPDPAGPTGGGALYDREAFREVGGFDERIFLYYEDVDLALRLRAAGAECRLAPAARATHGYSETLGAGSPEKYAMTGWSRGYLLRRYGITRRPSTAIGALAREFTICLGQLVRDHTIAGARGRVQGWRAGGGLQPRTVPTGTVTQTSLAGALTGRLRNYLNR